MDREDIRDEIRRLVKDTATDPDLQRFTDTVLNDRINSVQEEMVVISGCLESRISANVTAGTREYDLPSYYLAVKIVQFKNSSNVYVKLDRTTEAELDLYNPDWRDSNEKSDPITHYYLRRNKIGLYPMPSATRSSALRLDFIRRPDELDDDSDIPFNQEYEYYSGHMGIAYGVARLCMLDEGEYDKADRLERKYAAKIKEMQRQMTRDNIDTRIINIYETSRARPRRTR